MMYLEEKLMIVEGVLGWSLSTQGFNEKYAIERHGLTQMLIFASPVRFVALYLEVRDGYLDLLYGPAESLDRSNSDTASFKYSEAVSLGRELRSVGMDVPEGVVKFYEPGVSEAAIKLLLIEARKRPREVLRLNETSSS
jgi:hypothetical protein